MLLAVEDVLMKVRLATIHPVVNLDTSPFYYGPLPFHVLINFENVLN